MHIYNLKKFKPSIVDFNYLSNLGIDIIPDKDTLENLLIGSKQFIENYQEQRLFNQSFIEKDIDFNEKVEIHNYTGKCPINTFEVNPIKKGCDIACLYCLVNDGEHFNDIILHKNYAEFIEKHLEKQGDKNVFYYFSPKSEAFQDFTLKTGVAHSILKIFIKHFEYKPKSKVRLFIASKAGIKQLNYIYEGQSILDLLKLMKDKVQFNTSIGIMPLKLHKIIEPNAAIIEERLEAIKLCSQNGIKSDSVLLQPILAPFLKEKYLAPFFEQLAEYGIVNIKPEFLTVSMQNLAMLSQFVGWYDKAAEKELLETYLPKENKNHIKQRSRVAPTKKWSFDAIDLLKQYANKHNISVSICYWVRSQLKISNIDIPTINKNGYQCLGYQTNLFENNEL